MDLVLIRFLMSMQDVTSFLFSIKCYIMGPPNRYYPFSYIDFEFDSVQFGSNKRFHTSVSVKVQYICAAAWFHTLTM